MNRRSVSDPLLLAGILLPLAAAMLVGAPPADPSLTSRVASAVASVSREKAPAVVAVRCRDDRGEVTGTGFHIDPTGTVCTLADFVREGAEISVIQGTRETPATLIVTDPRSGVSFLKTAASPSFLPPFPAAALRTGAPLVALGLGLGIDFGPGPDDGGQTAAPFLGLVTGRLDHEGERFFPVPLLTATLPSQAGRPGNPVLDLSGRLAGIVTGRGADRESCRILPAAAVEKLHTDLLLHGKPNPGWIGAVVEEAAVPEGRTRIAAVEPGSPAEKAGILPGDSLLSIANREIVFPQEVLEASFYLSAGDQVRITLSRGGALRRITLRCTEPPPAPDDFR